LWVPDEMVNRLGYEVILSDWNYSLVKTGFAPVPMYEDLSLLLPTSGSTGSPKLVRHCYRNIEANAENVKNLFQLTPDEKAMAILPMHYTMGLSVITSHLKAGATLLLSGRSLLDKGFWIMLKEATSFTGVPHSYDISKLSPREEVSLLLSCFSHWLNTHRIRARNSYQPMASQNVLLVCHICLLIWQ